MKKFTAILDVLKIIIKYGAVLGLILKAFEFVVDGLEDLDNEKK